MSISVVGSVVTFTSTSVSLATARSAVTTADGDVAVTFSFTITRNPLILRVGTTGGGQEVVPDMEFAPGFYVITLTPGATTYYVEWRLDRIGKATLENFARVAAGALSVTTPWAFADLESLRFQQSLSVAWAASSGYQTRVIERRGVKSWGVRLFQPEDGPFAPLNATDVSLTPAAQTGETTIMASAPLFSSADTGALLKISHTGQYETGSFTAVDDATDSVRVSGTEASRIFLYTVDFSTGTGVGTVVLERSIGNEVNWETVATHTSGVSTSYDDGLDNEVVYYRLRCSAYTSGTIAASLTHSQGITDGIARIVSVDADNEVTVDVLSPFSKTTASALWYWGYWGARFGWPQTVGMFDGRLFLQRADLYWGSAADMFETFAIGTADGDAVGRALTGRLASARWIKGVMKLLTGTQGSEHIITSGELSEVMKPANIMSRGVSSRGSADADAVVIDNNAIAFISKNKKRIYLMMSDGGDNVKTTDLTRLHKDVGGTSGFKQLAFQREPWPRLWALREDGVAAVLLLSEEDEVAAWARYTASSGLFKSIAVVTGETEDEVYFSVQRTISASTVYHTEKLASEEFDTISDAWRLQSAVEYSGAATTTLTGLSHLEGLSVYVWGNGRQSGPYTVSGGAITVDYAVTYAITGLLYTGKYKGGRLDYGGEQGVALTRQKQVKRLGMMIERTPGGALQWGPSYTSLATLEDRRETGEAYDSPLQLWTEDITKPFEANAERDQRLHIVMPSAGPATVLGLVPDVQTNEG